MIYLKLKSANFWRIKVTLNSNSKKSYSGDFFNVMLVFLKLSTGSHVILMGLLINVSKNVGSD